MRWRIENFAQGLFVAAAWIAVARLARIKSNVEHDLLAHVTRGEPSPYWAGFSDHGWQSFTDQEWEREKRLI